MTKANELCQTMPGIIFYECSCWENVIAGFKKALFTMINIRLIEKIQWLFIIKEQTTYNQAEVYSGLINVYHNRTANIYFAALEPLEKTENN